MNDDDDDDGDVMSACRCGEEQEAQIQHQKHVIPCAQMAGACFDAAISAVPTAPASGATVGDDASTWTAADA